MSSDGVSSSNLILTQGPTFHVKDTLFPNMVKATTRRAIRLGFAANLNSVREIDNLNAFVNFSHIFRIQRIKFEKKRILSL